MILSVTFCPYHFVLEPYIRMICLLNRKRGVYVCFDVSAVKPLRRQSTHTHSHTDTYKHAHTHICTHTSTHKSTRASTHTHTYKYTYTQPHVHIQAYKRTRIHAAIRKMVRQGLSFPVLGRVGQAVIL